MVEPLSTITSSDSHGVVVSVAPPPRAKRRRPHPPPPRVRPRPTSSHRTAPSGGQPRARRHAASRPACGSARRALCALRRGAESKSRQPSISVGLVRAKFGSVGISLLTLQGTGVPSRFPHAQDGRRRADLPVGSAQRRRRARGGASTRALSVARPEPTRAPRPNARHRESARFVRSNRGAIPALTSVPPHAPPHRSSAASRRRWRFPSSARARSSPRATRRTPPTRTTTC